MRQTVYIDVLFCVNFIIDYIMLVSVRHVMSLKARRIRLLLSAVLGGIFSLTLLLPPVSFILSVIMSIAEAVIMAAAAFMPVRMKTVMKASLLLFCISFCFCGAMTAVCALFSPDNTLIRNGSVYIGISPIVLILTTLICYVLLRIFYGILNTGPVSNSRCSASIEHNGRKINVKGMIDSGSTLHEPFSGECVIVGREDVFEKLTDVKKYMNGSGSMQADRNIRLVPFNSVGGNGVLPAFRPSKITIRSENTEIKVNAYLALCDKKVFSEDCEIIVPSELIMKGS